MLSKMKLVVLMSFLLLLPLCSSRSEGSHDETKLTGWGRPIRPPPPSHDETKPTGWGRPIRPPPPSHDETKLTGWGRPIRPPPPSHDEIKPTFSNVPPSWGGHHLR
ncbi:acidic proline-rich protein PRP25-like [Capsella rubella]|uniref:acidic proline-rich protein PRP25-like n=1 Tax=Capsella rubella TaxID=81985 RepID=UPI000CD54EC0|nr:acidic proline-rich protein PRP25-like [Capsella rubella]